jgi:hypothetical protein
MLIQGAIVCDKEITTTLHHTVSLPKKATVRQPLIFNVNVQHAPALRTACECARQYLVATRCDNQACVITV